MRALYCVVALFLGIGQAALCDETDYTEHYFQVCLLDTACQRNWNLYPGDLQLFDYLMITELMQPRSFDWEDICEDAKDEKHWLASLRTHPFCPPNYIRRGRDGCVCLAEAQCDEIPPSGFRLTDFGKILFIGIAIVFIVYIGFNQIKELRRIHRKEAATETKRRATTRARGNLHGIELEVSGGQAATTTHKVRRRERGEERL